MENSSSISDLLSAAIAVFILFFVLALLTPYSGDDDYYKTSIHFENIRELRVWYDDCPTNGCCLRLGNSSPDDSGPKKWKYNRLEPMESEIDYTTSTSCQAYSNLISRQKIFRERYYGIHHCLDILNYNKKYRSRFTPHNLTFSNIEDQFNYVWEEKAHYFVYVGQSESNTKYLEWPKNLDLTINIQSDYRFEMDVKCDDSRQVYSRITVRQEGQENDFWIICNNSASDFDSNIPSTNNYDRKPVIIPSNNESLVKIYISAGIPDKLEFCSHPYDPLSCQEFQL